MSFSSSVVRLEVRMRELYLVADDLRRSQQRSEDALTQKALVHGTIPEQCQMQMLQSQAVQHDASNTPPLLESEIATSKGVAYSACRMNRLSQQQGVSPSKVQISSRKANIIQADQYQPCNTVSVGTMELGRQSCSLGCPCVCHTSHHVRTPRLLDQFIGSLSVGHSNTPPFTPSCDALSCKGNFYTMINVKYYFPRWLLYRSLIVMIQYTRRDGPRLDLRMPRVCSIHHLLFQYTVQGNVKGIKLLLERGEASPLDICQFSGMSALQVHQLSFPMKVRF